MSLEDFLQHLDDVPAEKIPALLAQLAAAQGVLAARLLQNGNGNGAHAGAGEKGKLLTVKQAAERIEKSTDWLYRHASTLPYTVRVGGALRFSEAGIEKWIRSRSGR